MPYNGFLPRSTQKREFRNPEEVEFAVVNQVHLLCQLKTQATQHVPDNRILVCGKQQQISRFTAHCFYQRFELILGHEF